VLTLAETAQFLRLGLEATRALFECGELLGTSLNQKHAVFLREDLISYLRETSRRQAAQRRATAAPAAPARPRVARTGRPRRTRLPDLDRAEASYAAQLGAHKP
jgi:hypothetical protein